VPQPPTNPEPARATQPQPPPLGKATNSLRIRLPLANVVAAIPNSSPPQNTLNKENPVKGHQPQGNLVIQGVGFTLQVVGPTTVHPKQAAVGEEAVGGNEADISEGEDDGEHGQRTFVLCSTVTPSSK
jgi:hypothetical protein